MGRYCAVWGCSNTAKEGVSLFQFPKDAKLRNTWSAQVKKTRAKWKGPSAYSAICSDHFSPECFDSTSATAKKLGFKMKQRLRPDAVPTIFPRPSAPPPKQPRMSRAYEKRECSRILNEAVDKTTKKCETGNMDVGATTDTSSTISVKPLSIATQADLKVAGRNIRVQVRPNVKDRDIQANVKPPQKDIGIQCELYQDECLGCAESSLPKCSTPIKELPAIPCPNFSYEESADSNSDVTFCEPSETEFQCTSQAKPHEEKKYLVFESNLLSLFTSCPRCGACIEPTTYQKGTFVGILQECVECNYKRQWASQPISGGTPFGNLLLSASILFAGALPTKTLRVFQVLNCASISLSTFYDHQNLYLHPTIMNVWNRQQKQMVEVLQAFGKPLSLGGDARNDSPGHSAKYGSYSFMELEHNVILDVQLLQSTEVKSSNNMEKEGLIRGLEFFDSKNLPIGLLVTDRHKEINAWLRQNRPEIEHKFDVWHVAKSFRKKVNNLAKEKGCDIIGQWSKSMVNHLYWCALSTENGDGDVMLEKWLSLLNHVHNKHRGHGKLYKKCTHTHLRSRKWLKRHTKPSEKLADIVQKKQMCTDVKKLSNSHQTSNVEAFHSLIIQFAPKHTAFSYAGMKSRLCLAALHYNYNSSKKQAKTKTGEAKYSISFPKYKKGGFIVRKMMSKSSYGYTKDLLAELMEVYRAGGIKGQTKPSFPGYLCSTFDRPNKKDAIKEMQTRFSVRH